MTSAGARRVGGLAASLVLAGLPRVAAAQPPTLAVVLDRAAGYVERFVEELSTVVMEEDYRQSYFDGGRSNPTRLRLVSEFLLVRVQDEGIDLPSHGRFCIDPGSGRVIETALELRHPGLEGRPRTDASATVAFGPAPGLELWVPLEMRERYIEAGGTRRTNSTATYRDFRQFSVDVTEAADAPPAPAEPR